MCNAWNHPADCTCGWGGEGHLGSSVGFTGSPADPAGCYTDARGLAWLHAHDVCRPTSCPRCQRQVYFVRHNGGSVWFDELGWPWPIHPCFASGTRPDAGASALYGVHLSTNTTARVSAALLTLLGRTPNARLGLVTRVSAMGSSIRIAVVTTSDGDDREVVIEQNVEPSLLAGAIAAFTPDDCLVAFLCDGNAVYGWWLDQPPGEWRIYSSPGNFRVGVAAKHNQFGFGVVVQALPGQTTAGKVRVLFTTGETRTFIAARAGLQALVRNRHYTPRVKLAAPARAVSAAKPCPHCGWHGRKLIRHLRLHHGDLAK